MNQKVGQIMLRKLGHRVDPVGNGSEALAAVQALPYDVVLMDVQMPEMDRLQATRLIRSELPAHRQPHIVATTASVLLEDREACSEAGMDDYLTKPVRGAELAPALSRVPLRTPTPGDPGHARTVSAAAATATRADDAPVVDAPTNSSVTRPAPGR